MYKDRYIDCTNNNKYFIQVYQWQFMKCTWVDILFPVDSLSFSGLVAHCLVVRTCHHYHCTQSPPLVQSPDSHSCSVGPQLCNKIVNFKMQHNTRCHTSCIYVPFNFQSISMAPPTSTVSLRYFCEKEVDDNNSCYHFQKDLKFQLYYEFIHYLWMTWNCSRCILTVEPCLGFHMWHTLLCPYHLLLENNTEGLF